MRKIIKKEEPASDSKGIKRKKEKKDISREGIDWEPDKTKGYVRKSF